MDFTLSPRSRPPAAEDPMVRTRLQGSSGGEASPSSYPCGSSLGYTLRTSTSPSSKPHHQPRRGACRRIAHADRPLLATAATPVPCACSLVPRGRRRAPRNLTPPPARNAARPETADVPRSWAGSRAPTFFQKRPPMTSETAALLPQPRAARTIPSSPGVHRSGRRKLPQASPQFSARPPVPRLPSAPCTPRRLFALLRQPSPSCDMGASAASRWFRTSRLTH